REMQIFYVTELARLAHDLGSRLVRVFTGYSTAAASPEQGWNWCVEGLRECARRAAEFDVTMGVQNHHDMAAHYESLFDLLTEINEPNCLALFDAWSPALHGSSVPVAVTRIGPPTVPTTL